MDLINEPNTINTIGNSALIAISP